MVYETLDFSQNQAFFDKIKEEQQKYRESENFVSLPEIPEYKSLEDQFKDLTTMDDIILGTLIKEYWTRIVDEAYTKSDNAVNRIFIFTNIKFIKGLTKYLSSVNIGNIDFFRIARINSMAYNYCKCTQDSEIIKAFKNLTKLINRSMIGKLNSYVTVDEDTANELVVARYSSEDMAEAATALNSVIMKTSMSSENIIDVYHVLYDHISEIFTGVMYDCRSSFADSHEQEMYEKCSTAILDYLNMQERGVIYGCLDYYTQNSTFFYQGRSKRMHLRTIPIDKYERILWQIKELEITKNYFVD